GVAVEERELAGHVNAFIGIESDLDEAHVLAFALDVRVLVPAGIFRFAVAAGDLRDLPAVEADARAAEGGLAAFEGVIVRDEHSVLEADDEDASFVRHAQRAIAPLP